MDGNSTLVALATALDAVLRVITTSGSAGAEANTSTKQKAREAADALLDKIKERASAA